MKKKEINEATGSGSSGYYKAPLVLVPQIWEKDSLAPFNIPVSKYKNNDLAYDDEVGQPLNVSKKEADRIEKKTRQMSKYSNDVKKSLSGQNDEDGGNLNESLRDIIKRTLRKGFN